MTVSDATSAQPASGQLPLTPSQIEGPYFRLGAPRREYGRFDFAIAQVTEKDNVTRASLDGRV